MRTRMVIPMVAVLALSGTLLLFRHRPQPTYEGRPMGQWLLSFDGSGSAEDRRARQAVRALGTNAIPPLLEHLSARDSKAMHGLKQIMGKQSMVGVRFPDPRDIRYQALEGFAALGSMALPAIPELMRLVVEEANEEAALAIVLVGRDAAPKLSGMLAHSDWRYRYAAISILMDLDLNSAEAAVPLLIERLDDEAWQVRRTAGYTLEKYFNPQPFHRLGFRSPVLQERAQEPDQRVFLNALIPCLDDGHPRVRATAVSLIGRLGPVAKPAVHSVTELIEDENAGVRRYAREALARIDPDGATGFEE